MQVLVKLAPIFLTLKRKHLEISLTISYDAAFESVSLHCVAGTTR